MAEKQTSSLVQPSQSRKHQLRQSPSWDKCLRHVQDESGTLTNFSEKSWPRFQAEAYPLEANKSDPMLGFFLQTNQNLLPNMELLISRENLSHESSGKNVGKMSIMRCKRQLQFHVVQFDQSGNVLPSKRPRLASDGQDKRDGKGKENSFAATLCDRSYSTHQQVQPNT